MERHVKNLSRPVKNDYDKYLHTPKFKDLWILGPFLCWLVCVVDIGSAIGQAPDLKVVSLAWQSSAHYHDQF